MAEQTTETKSKEYIRPMPATWWLRRKTYFWFMVRELTSVFVGGYAVFLLVLVARAGNAEAFAAQLKHPLSIAVQVIALPMVLYHSITWFNLTPKVMIVWRGEEKVSPFLIAAANYAAWIVLSILVICLVVWMTNSASGA